MATPEANIAREAILEQLRTVTAKLNEQLTVVEANPAVRA